MEWRLSQDHLNRTGQLRNFDLNTSGYVGSQCNDPYLYPDKCTNANKLASDVVNEKLAYIQSSKGNEAKQKEYNERRDGEAWREVYPFNNVDFDYGQYVKNIYNPYSLGVTNQPTFPGIFSSINKLGNYAGAVLEHPTPSEGAIAGKTDVNPYNEELKEIKRLTDNFPLPYPTFRNDFPEYKYPTTGEYASSYFYQQGWCPTPIVAEVECKAKKYKWVPTITKTTLPAGYDAIQTTNRTANEVPGYEPNSDERLDKIPQEPEGSCFKPRFAYINNSAKGSMIFKGLVPSMANHLFNFRPDSLISPIASFTNTNLLPCIEDFTIGVDRYGILHILLAIVIVLFAIKIKY